MYVKCHRLFFLVIVSFLAPFVSAAGCLDAPRLTGINQAGAEFNSTKLPGEIHKDYTYPVAADLAFIAAQGANVIRLPIRWERIQPTVLTPLNPAELLRLHSDRLTRFISLYRNM
ncbi:MAG: hypothetical protein EOO68_11395 [Moraxellaceae bacterium]|nr:MAG: hypothetical protein EOO68_11395 [Moraxellaceae bacterium]